MVKVKGSTYEHFEYMQVDALADMLEELGIIFPNEPYRFSENEPPIISWSYKLPDGTEGGRDDRWQAADEVRRHYTHKMFRREETENGLSEFQVQHEAEINLIDPFNYLRRGLAKLEVNLYCRSKEGLPKSWPQLTVDFVEGLSDLVGILTRVLASSGQQEMLSTAEAQQEAKKLKEMDSFFATEGVKAIAKETSKRHRRELYVRARELMNGVRKISMGLYHLQGFSKEPNEE